ncbi:DUF1672 domain-containing protein [Staphylococcus aureus]|uniref:DUF1672 domain-containing protein n=1 Tax=Staphylococcus aureus TaxID=1280 RepID=UPI0021CF800F|nr:DUF1672 domain-containing protein [Staphylococcus aureus]MCC1454170.1 DUF1672 domain-containing protein [Staphylococcus aureus]MCU4274251.1 lipoprotein [Staphylococcus aureus]HAR3188246.1 DUF1672 domain-containing protein [Staphylococcus aureus]HAR3426325.1 DUF1672 domain-containing protein [Staphylococcus aureus]HCZ0384759.1 DUF1672 domain-containing protein [Staphylococcus aureus]
MKKFIGSVLATTLILGGCSTMENESKKDTKTETKSVPEEMEASKYVGQGFQPPAEKNAIEFAKKHRKEFEKVGEQFFKDNFGLKVKATNVVGKDDGVEVYVHCEDHGIVFNASLPLYKDAIHQKGSMRSNDNGDDMSMMVGTVLSGFEYRAQKEKYDKLYKFFKDNEEKYQYTGFTKEAINKTQNSGYENEYFYISAIPYNLAEYRDYFEPLLNKSDSEFSKELSNVKKQLKDKSKVSVTTTLFSKKKNYTKKSNSENVIKMAEEIKKDKEIPNGIELSIKFSDNKINTVKPNFNGESTSEYGVFDQE